MNRLALRTSIAAMLAVFTLQAQNPFSGDAKAAYEQVKVNILQSG
ncbi:MAG TPA: hypothetical protein VGG97_23545 [Bryobacteraceae bacterium]|jgi:hypothetical protein